MAFLTIAARGGPADRVKDRERIEVVAPVSDLAVDDRQHRDVAVAVGSPGRTTRPCEAYSRTTTPVTWSLCTARS